MEKLTEFGIPIIGILIGGFLVWATTQVCKRAIKAGKEKYLAYSGFGSLVLSCLVVATVGEWSWLTYAWTVVGSWLAANLGHKFYARKLKKYMVNGD